MQHVNLVFPHQLFEVSPLLDNGAPVYLVEEFLFFRQYAFHKQKIAFHRASMKSYEGSLTGEGVSVEYIDSTDALSDIRKLIEHLSVKGVQVVEMVDVCDNWLEKRIRESAEKAGIEVIVHDSPGFINTREDLGDFFKPGKKKYFQTEFYIGMRKKLGILVEGEDKPVGGKWSFDAENRLKYPKNMTPPKIQYLDNDECFDEAVEYTNLNFPNSPGLLDHNRIYATNHETARIWLTKFLEERFAGFGAYEDAIVAKEHYLHHSVLTPMLNVGLLTPSQIISETLKYTENNDIDINSVEGFIRQIIGWREFIRGIYQVRGTYERTRNFWGFDRKIPASFYDGTTGIDPVDITIKKLLKTGYSHHIERLMVLGNFMVLCEFDPDEVHRWFMEMYIDSYDWVMVPNVYGMSQFADGGLMSTKPYISGSNYLGKMSDYGKGDWQEIWDALFWRFMHVHREFFSKNPRLGMLVKTFDKMSAEKQEKLIETAENFLKSLDK